MSPGELGALGLGTLGECSALWLRAVTGLKRILWGTRCCSSALLQAQRRDKDILLA